VGDNSYGQLGLGLKTGEMYYIEDRNMIYTPTRVLKLPKVKEIISGAMFIFVICKTEIRKPKKTVVYCWGMNIHGQLGIGSRKYSCENSPVSFHFDHKIAQIQCGTKHTVILTSIKVVSIFVFISFYF
jgi:alpha-tubulin suppressor-like RCC1 family protein